MKKLCALFGALLFAAASHGATYTHINWSWTEPASNSVPVAGFNLYITSSACSTSFSTASQTPVNGTTLIALTSYQTAYTANQTGCAYVTSVSAMGVESAPSAGFPINTNPPTAPTSLVATPAP